MFANRLLCEPPSNHIRLVSQILLRPDFSDVPHKVLEA